MGGPLETWTIQVFVPGRFAKVFRQDKLQFSGKIDDNVEKLTRLGVYGYIAQALDMQVTRVLIEL